MSDRITIADVRERCENLNRRMERRGSAVRYSVERRYDYVGLDRTNIRGDVQSTVRCGSKREIGELLHAMMVALDDAEVAEPEPEPEALDPVELYDRTFRPREAVRVARGWLLDCFGEEDEVEAIRLLNDVGIVAAIERHYSGGWQTFTAAEGLWSGLTPRERAALAVA